jgi:uncharacterized coiled-coil protein SlyX
MLTNPLFLGAAAVALVVKGIYDVSKAIKDADGNTRNWTDGINALNDSYGTLEDVLGKDILGKIPTAQVPRKTTFMQDDSLDLLDDGITKVKTTIDKIQEALNTVVSKQMTEWEKKMSNIYELAVEGVFKGIAGISRALAESIILGKNLGEALKNLVRQALVDALAAVIRMVLEKAFLVLLEKLFGIEIKKATDMEQKKLGIMKKQTSELAKQAGLRILLALLGAAEGGQVRGQKAEGGSVLRRASGGRTTQTNAYLVGERGRELFVPNQDGEIISNERLQNLGTSVNFTINATDVKGVKELLIDNRATIVNIINGALNQKGKAALV